MTEPGGNRLDALQFRLKVSDPPRDNRAVFFQGITGEGSRRNRLYARQILWDAGLIIIVQTPPDYRAIGLQRQTVPKPGGNGNHTRQIFWNLGDLAISVVSPGSNRAIRIDRNTVGLTSSDRYCISHSSRHCALTQAVPAPGDDCSV